MRHVEISYTFVMYIPVVGFLQDSSNTLMVEAYIWADQNDPNLYGEWDFEVI